MLVIVGIIGVVVLAVNVLAICVIVNDWSVK